jgi:hypothetical protein
MSVVESTHDMDSEFRNARCASISPHKGLGAADNDHSPVLQPSPATRTYSAPSILQECPSSILSFMKSLNTDRARAMSFSHSTPAMHQNALTKASVDKRVQSHLDILRRQVQPSSRCLDCKLQICKQCVATCCQHHRIGPFSKGENDSSTCAHLKEFRAEVTSTWYMAPSLPSNQSTKTKLPCSPKSFTARRPTETQGFASKAALQPVSAQTLSEVDKDVNACKCILM